MGRSALLRAYAGEDVVEAAPAEPRGWHGRVAALSSHRYGTWLVAAIAFADSSLLPVPPDLLLVPMCLLRPARTRWLMIVCTVASALGAMLGYVIGYGLWNSVGVRLVEFYGCQQSIAVYQQLVEQWGVPVIILKAFTPIPFKIAAIAAGVAEMNPVAFIVAAVVGRAVHFAILAGLLLLFGDRVTALCRQYYRPVALASIVALIGFAVVYTLK